MPHVFLNKAGRLIGLFLCVPLVPPAQLGIPVALCLRHNRPFLMLRVFGTIDHFLLCSFGTTAGMPH
jgi:hypothetical protein